MVCLLDQVSPEKEMLISRDYLVKKTLNKINKKKAQRPGKETK